MIGAMAESSPSERRQVHYSGRVQGVGFRYEAQRLASGYAVAGFVQNLPDGRVKLVVEGAPTELDRFLTDLAQRMSELISQAVVDVGPATNEFAGFEVRR
jgi:acylphosphatase